ncbi:hypothetical protein N865_07625 [Intrasporangium oryzae NRRL B-24470]|uniref:Uncharacterized protein n=1 Tax=Intrasporangium oryzae NRRL B-24470 TaxID=1386089 RepID=W9GCX7_9MICO|nr:hypothetical protein [Intrasporangium oryzae]EWT01719.1 hypothetical protein N865_07625 [Intrasporangium oryzae NRRL B-24470]
MPAIAFAAPLRPGKTEIDRLAMESCWRGRRKEAYQDARRRAGITKESVWLQSTPNGDLAVVYIEADDIGAALAAIAGSAEPFDRWFREHIHDVHGIALEDGFPTAVPLLDFDIDRAGQVGQVGQVGP